MRWKLDRSYLVAALGLAGCSPGVEFLRLLEAPNLSGAVVVHRGVQVRALAVREGEPIRLEEVRAEDSVVVLRYQATLEELGLESGLLDASRARSCRLLDPEQIWVMAEDSDGDLAMLRDQRSIEVLRPPEMTQAVVGREPRRCARCPSFDVVGLRAGVMSRPTTALALPSGDVLVAYWPSDMFLVSRFGIEPIDCGIFPFALTLLPDGRIWAGNGSESSVLELNAAARTCTQVDAWPLPLSPPETSGQFGPVRAVAAPAGHPDELWVLTGTGQLWRRADATWPLATTLEIYPRDLELGIASAPNLAWLAPNRVVASMSNNHIVFVEDGRARTEAPPVTGNPTTERDRLPGLGVLRDGTVLVGGSSGEVFVRQTSDFRLYEGTPVPEANGDVTAFLEFEEGVVFVVEGGRIVYASKERPLCPAVTRVPGSVGSGALAFAFEDGSMFVANFVGSSTSQGEVTWILPRTD